MVNINIKLGRIKCCGGKLKEAGNSHWLSSNLLANNESGFTALPGGYRNVYNDITYEDMGTVGLWWTATKYSEFKAWFYGVVYNDSNIYRGETVIHTGYSVRCIKD